MQTWHEWAGAGAYVQASAQEFGATHVLLPGDRAVLDLLAAVKRASFLEGRRHERIEGETPNRSEKSRAELLLY